MSRKAEAKSTLMSDKRSPPCDLHNAHTQARLPLKNSRKRKVRCSERSQLGGNDGTEQKLLRARVRPFGLQSRRSGSRKIALFSRGKAIGRFGRGKSEAEKRDGARRE